VLDEGMKFLYHSFEVTLVEKKLLFFDIDGTLMDYHQGMREMPKDTIETLDALRKEGHEVFLATGRCHCFIMPEVMWYPFSGYITCNGGYVEYKGENVFKKTASVEAIKAVVALSEKYRFNYYLESRDYIYVRDKQDQKHQKFARDWGMTDESVIDDFNPEDIECYIGMIVINNKDEQQLVIDTLSPYFDVQRHRAWFSFDLTIKETSKGRGIVELAKVLHSDMKDTIAFGDGRNDVEMLQTAHLGIAMGNAMTEALEAADYITDRVENAGIKKACQYFKLIP